MEEAKGRTKMLSNPKWTDGTPNVKGVDDALTLGCMIKWLEQQPGNKVYNYGDNDNCAIAQYLKASGFGNVTVFLCSVAIPGHDRHIRLPHLMDEVARMAPHTLGDALKRARKYKRMAA